MRCKLLILFLGLSLSGYCQLSQAAMDLDTSAQSIKEREAWLKNLYEMGVEKKKDSLRITAEVNKLIKDSAYRSSVYPEQYSWSTVVPLLRKMELKKAFWQLINVYMADTSLQNRKQVVGTLVLYDSLIDMEKVLLDAYYTYAFTDPRVCRFKKGKPEIYRPDLLENTLYATKELINYINYYRKEKYKGIKK